jgi:SAM-dependent methyltransferase
MPSQANNKVHVEEAALKYPGLQYQPDHGKSISGVRQAIRSFLRAQFGRPSGFWGAIAGSIMASAPSNQDRIRWTISLLDIKPNDRVLEIGFGPGYAIKLISQIASEGFVAGVDHSEVMVHQAGKRNAKAMRNGSVELRCGSASNLPKFDKPFDKIFTINSIHFWTEPVDCLRRLHELLKPGGLIAVTLQPRSRGSTSETSEAIGKEIVTNLKRAGFKQTRLEIHQAKPVSIACAIGIR